MFYWFFCVFFLIFIFENISKNSIQIVSYGSHFTWNRSYVVCEQDYDLILGRAFGWRLFPTHIMRPVCVCPLRTTFRRPQTMWRSPLRPQLEGRGHCWLAQMKCNKISPLRSASWGPCQIKYLCNLFQKRPHAVIVLLRQGRTGGSGGSPVLSLLWPRDAV